MTPKFDKLTEGFTRPRDLTPQDKRRIIAMMQDGSMSRPEIAARFNVTPETISRIGKAAGVKMKTTPRSGASKPLPDQLKTQIELYMLHNPTVHYDVVAKKFGVSRTVVFELSPNSGERTRGDRWAAARAAKAAKLKTEGVDRVNVIKSRTDELAKSFISKGMKPEEAIKIAAIQAEKEYYKKLDDLKKDQQGHIAIQNVKNTKFPPRYKKIDGKKYKL